MDPSNKQNKIAVIDETYLIMSVVLLSIIIGAILIDTSRKPNTSSLQLLKFSYFFTPIMSFLAFLGLIMSLPLISTAIITADKNEVLSYAGRNLILWQTASILGCVSAYCNLRRVCFFLCLLCLLLNVYIGFRSSMAIVIISICVFHLFNMGRQRLLIKHWKTSLLILLVGLLFLLYKQVYVIVLLQRWDILLSRLTDIDFYINAITESEPFTTQAILNEVVKTGFSLDISAFSSVANALLLFAGDGSKSFNAYFQPVLFPDVSYGMAHNIWAQMWSIGRFPLLLMFIFIFNRVLFLGSWALHRFQDKIIISGLLPLLSYWSFYIHRNDLAYQINLEKRVILVWGACVIVCYLMPTKKKYLYKVR
ncbi:hypothetical protein [Nodularia spumigena]|uniref:hypothetical protein n=1 Tax=Nodularia spumigena TaxID=70799 RepID=UPI00232F8F74|nr:hypothetical protein [Nodularia spumigena]MDB9317336.1 hypothetical protein [Nodularia spumigena CS-590/01A]MDB9325895.1 hypothetical protein [Nodularia spumigena CS-590/02]MDB9335121.1 hypothetical protein [Nodularia spumigena CS-590/01]